MQRMKTSSSRISRLLFPRFRHISPAEIIINMLYFSKVKVVINIFNIVSCIMCSCWSLVLSFLKRRRKDSFQTSLGSDSGNDCKSSLKSAGVLLFYSTNIYLWFVSQLMVLHDVMLCHTCATSCIPSVEF